MQHIASCAGENVVGTGGKERKRVGLDRSVYAEVTEGASRNNVLAHFLKPPPDPPRRASRLVIGILRGKKSDGRVEV